MTFLFGAYAQVVAGILLAIATVLQTVYWEVWGYPPSNNAIFIVSMEALLFASYSIIAAAAAIIWLDKRTPDKKGEQINN